MIYTSHYMEEVEFLCRTIHIVDGGKKLASGSKASLLKKIDNQSRLVAACDNLTPQILEEIKGLPSLNSVTYQEDKLQMTTHHTTRLMGELIHLLGAHGMALSSLDVYQPNLETVFLELTGKALRD